MRTIVLAFLLITCSLTLVVLPVLLGVDSNVDPNVPNDPNVRKYVSGLGENVGCYTPADRSTQKHVTVLAGMGMVFTTNSPLVQFSLSAYGTSNITRYGGAVGMVIGTGTPPKPDTPLHVPYGYATGNPIISQKIFDVAFAGQRIPLSFTDFWGYLTPGTYWFDVDWNVAGGGRVSLSHITICIASV